jgi:hypothetical protein
MPYFLMGCMEKSLNGRGGSIGRAATWVGFGRLLVAKWKVNENDDASDHSIIACWLLRVAYPQNLSLHLALEPVDATAQYPASIDEA